jgi:dolichol-phosphate mannosyltransferase
MRTIVVIPTYNECANIQALVPEILAQLRALGESVGILVVDDNSPDGTGQKVEQMGRSDPRIMLLARPQKAGLGSAYVAGFRKALSLHPELIVQMDADFSHKPEVIPSLIDETRNADLIIGSRYVCGVNITNWPLQRLLLSYFANIYARGLTRVPVQDLTGGFKCFRAEALASVPLNRIRSDGYAFQIETTYWCFRNGFNIKEIPIVFEDRHSGTSKMTKEIVREAFWLVLRLAIHTIFHRRRAAPPSVRDACSD